MSDLIKEYLKSRLDRKLVLFLEDPDEVLLGQEGQEPLDPFDYTCSVYGEDYYKFLAGKLEPTPFWPGAFLSDTTVDPTILIP